MTSCLTRRPGRGRIPGRLQEVPVQPLLRDRFSLFVHEVSALRRGPETFWWTDGRCDEALTRPGEAVDLRGEFGSLVLRVRVVEARRHVLGEITDLQLQARGIPSVLTRGVCRGESATQSAPESSERQSPCSHHPTDEGHGPPPARRGGDRGFESLHRHLVTRRARPTGRRRVT